MSIANPSAALRLFERAGKTSIAAALACAAIGFASPALAQDEGGPRVEVSEFETIELFVQEEEITKVLELLSLQTQKSIVASNEVSGKVSANLFDVTFTEALDIILNVNGFHWLEQNGVIFVYSQAEWELLEQSLRSRVIKVFDLSYLDAESAKSFVEPLLSSDGGQIITSENASDFPTVGELPIGGEDYALAAKLVVYDYEENIDAIGALVAELDTRPAQVLVEATILQTSLTEANAFGVDFSIIADIDFSAFTSSGGPLGVVNNLLGTGSAPTFPADNQATSVVGTAGNTSGPGTLKVGVVADEVAVFVKLLDEVSDTTILSNPKILTLNRQPARVLVGRRVGYLSTTSTDTSTTQTVEFLDTGTQLYMRPFVSASGEIRMELKPQVSEAILREQTDITGVVVTIPDEVTQEIVTNINVRDGQTIVLGGLFRESTSLTRRQVPFLGDLPLVGAAFRGSEDDVSRSEIIFMITPTIVTDTLIAQSAERTEADVQRIRAGSRQGLLPWSRDRMTAGMNVEAERLAREGDYDMAMWYIGRSLSLNPVQPDVMRLRERLQGEREIWPSRSMLNYHFDHELIGRAEDLWRPKVEPKEPWMDRQHPLDKRPSPLAEPEAGVGARPFFFEYDRDGDGVYDLLPKGFDPFSARFSVHTPGDDAKWIHPTEKSFDRDYAFESISRPEPVSVFEFNTAGVESFDAPEPFVGRSVEELDAAEMEAFEAMQTLAASVRGNIALFETMNGELPELGAADDFDGWQVMLESGLMQDAPVNPWVDAANASKVVVGSAPDSSFHNDYGWIFNPKTGELWPASFDISQAPLARSPFDSNESITGVETTPND